MTWTLFGEIPEEIKADKATPAPARTILPSTLTCENAGSDSRTTTPRTPSSLTSVESKTNPRRFLIRPKAATCTWYGRYYGI